MRPEDLAFAPGALGSSGTTVTWLGTAGFAVEHDGWVVLIDPYVTRASIGRCLRAPLRTDVRAVARFTPRADAIIAGHTHFDHVLDVPTIAHITRAKVFGSRSCVHLCRAADVPEERLVDVSAHTRREPLRAQVGPFELRFVPSVHSALLLGRVPFPGDISDCDQLPLRTTQYRCGAVFAVDIRVAGRRIYHLGSADLLDGQCEPGVDLLLMCVAGWTTTERFVPRMMGSLGPGAILLSHWDDFFSPMDRGARMLPAMRMPTLVDRLTAIDPGVKIGTVPLLGQLEV